MSDLKKDVDEVFGGGWTEVGSAGDNPIWDFENQGEFVGVLIDKLEGIGPNSSMMYNVESAKDHNKYAIWGSTVIDMRMKNVNIGEEIKVVYNGKEKNEKTGRTFKSFSVFHRAPAFKEA